MIQTVKLAKLRLSPSNVRKTGDLALEQLADDIAARGVLQNLLITPVAKPRGFFDVFAGGRRLRALDLLAERGTIVPDDYDVPVRILKGDDAELSELSTAENFQRLAMTPADECRAFQHFLGKDGDIDAVAKRFGITRRFVEGRLRLAALAEPIFEALSRGEITLDLAKAYASTESQEKQLHVWESYGSQGYASPDTIRRVIANESMKAGDPVALLVGADAYQSAGGRIDRDLFSDAGDRWLDPEIAQRLAAEAMEAEARRIGEETGLAWIRPIATSSTWNAAADLHRVTLPTIEPDEAEQAQIASIEADLETIAADMEDEEVSEEAYKALDERYDALAAERERLLNRPVELTDEIRSRVGKFLTLTHKGEMVLDDTFFSETPYRVGGSDDDGRPGDRDAAGEGGRSGGVEPRPEAVAPGGKPLSAKLYDELAVQRRDVLAATLLAHPALALDYALFVMIDGKERHGSYGSTVQARRPQDPMVGELPDSRACGYIAEVREALEASWTEPADEVDRFEAFRVLDDDAKAAWLAYIVATSLEAKTAWAARQCALQNRLATIMDVDVASWWRPTSKTFFDRVSKSTLLSLLDEVGGPALSGRHAAQKKPDISASCEKLFAGDAIVEAEVKQAALAWVPNAMRFLDGVPGEPEPLEAEDDLPEADDGALAEEDAPETVVAAE